MSKRNVTWQLCICRKCPHANLAVFLFRSDDCPCVHEFIYASYVLVWLGSDSESVEDVSHSFALGLDRPFKCGRDH
jgi:hypothetical protein